MEQIGLGSRFRQLQLLSTHLLAGLSIRSAGSSTSLHFFVIAHLFAAIRTSDADCGADAAFLGVEVGLPQHEIRAGSATLGTVEKQFDVVRSGMLAALSNAMGYGLATSGVAGLAFEMQSYISLDDEVMAILRKLGCSPGPRAFTESQRR